MIEIIPIPVCHDQSRASPTSGTQHNLSIWIPNPAHTQNKGLDNITIKETKYHHTLNT